MTVKTAAGEVKIGAGDFGTFPKGLDCGWTVEKPIRKHYNFLQGGRASLERREKRLGLPEQPHRVRAEAEETGQGRIRAVLRPPSPPPPRP